MNGRAFRRGGGGIPSGSLAKWGLWLGLSLGLHWWGVGALGPLALSEPSVAVERGRTPLESYILTIPRERDPEPEAATPEPEPEVLTVEEAVPVVERPPEAAPKPEAAPEPEVVPEPLEPEMEREEPEPKPEEPEPEPTAPMEKEEVPPPLPDPSGPRAGAAEKPQPQATVSPAPRYPRIAVRKGIEGVVRLAVEVGADGRPVRVDLESSSGHAFLDREARKTVEEKWRFEVTPETAKAFSVMIEFRLDR